MDETVKINNFGCYGSTWRRKNFYHCPFS